MNRVLGAISAKRSSNSRTKIFAPPVLSARENGGQIHCDGSELLTHGIFQSVLLILLVLANLSI